MNFFIHLVGGGWAQGPLSAGTPMTMAAVRLMNRNTRVQRCVLLLFWACTTVSFDLSTDCLDAIREFGQRVEQGCTHSEKMEAERALKPVVKKGVEDSAAVRLCASACLTRLVQHSEATISKRCPQSHTCTCAARKWASACARLPPRAHLITVSTCARA